MDLQNYNTEDFLNDKSFVRWVIDPNSNTLSHWEQYLEKYPEKQEDFKVATELILNVKPKINDEAIDKQTSEIWLTLEDKLKNQSEIKRSFISRSLTSQWVQIAATLLVVMGLSFFVSNYFNNTDQSNVQALSTLVKKSNPKGRKSTITLSDKTKVDLNAESSIEYLSSFDADKRVVSLTGEAFFDVTRDESRPFIIKVNGIDVKVLGTSFNVKAYPGSEDIQVAVLSGNVEVYDQARKNVVNLEKDEMVDFRFGSKDFNKHQIEDKDLVFAWKDQKLVFRNQDLETIVKVLSRWYGVEINFDGITNRSKEITGSYTNASLKEVMQSLSHNYQFEYELNGKKLRIYNK